MPRLRNTEPFHKEQDIDAWLEQVSEYLLVNDIGVVAADGSVEVKTQAERRRMAALLTLLGETTYELLRGVLSPKLPSEQKYDDLVVFLKEQLGPRRLVVTERFTFRNRWQREGRVFRSTWQICNAWRRPVSGANTCQKPCKIS